MPAALMPGAVFKPVPYRAEAGRFAQAPLGWVPHVVVGNGSPFKTFANAVSPNRRFAHFWVAKDGTIEQYAETYYKSWAQAAGNGQYWSVETEGFPDEPYTEAQLNSLAKIHKFLGAPDKIANTPGQPGVGTHYMGGAAWGGHSCPDPQGKEGTGPRSKARADIIARANVATPTPAKPVAPTPAPPVIKPSTTDPAKVKALQVLLELPADGKWGSDTDQWAVRLRTAARAKAGYPTNVVKPFNVRAVQGVIRTLADGRWGPGSQAALDVWIKAVQAILGVPADGAWGPGTDAAYMTLRRNNDGKF